MKIYTRTGDDGTTGLIGGKRVRKDIPRIEAYGTVDELNGSVGAARAALASGRDATLDAALERVQNELFSLGAELATNPSHGAAPASVGAANLEALERDIDGWEAELTPLKNFILPGGCPAAALLHVARTVCRRAEREVLRLTDGDLGDDGSVSANAVRYLNRLSDHLFVAARTANRLACVEDVIWRSVAADTVS